MRPLTWAELQPLLQEFWRQARATLTVRSAPGRLKQWLGMLTRTYPEAMALFVALRRELDLDRIDLLLNMPARQSA